MEKIIEKFYYESKNDSLSSSEMIMRQEFSFYLLGMKEKLRRIKTIEARKQFDIIERMERNIERQIYITANHCFQAKFILLLTAQITALEEKNIRLESELAEIKNNLK